MQAKVDAPVASLAAAEADAPSRVKVECLADLRQHEDRVWAVDWHPSGLVLATASTDKSVRLWSRCTKEQARAAVVGFLPKPKLTEAEEADEDRHWRPITTLDGEHSRTVRSLAWSPDGERLACASFDATVTIWRRESPQFDMAVESVLDGHESEVKSVAWDRSGRLVATCSRDKSVWLWDAEDAEAEDRTFECAAVLTGHAQDVKTVRWHPDSSRALISCGYDDSARVWREHPTRRDEWRCTQALHKHSSTVWDLAFQRLAADGTGAVSDAGEQPRLLATCSADTTVALWRERWAADEPDASEPQWECAATSGGLHTMPVYGLDWAPPLPCDEDAPDAAGCGRSSLLATASGDDSVAILRAVVKEGALGLEAVHVERKAHRSDVNAVRFAPKAVGRTTLFATVSDDGSLRVWRLTVLE